MNSDRLKELYRQYWEQRDQDQWWYNAYNQTVGRVDRRRATLRQSHLSATDDRELLDWLIAEKSASGNGISNARLCMLSQRNYERLIEDNDFLEAATRYMSEPTQDGFERLVSTGRLVIDAINDEPPQPGEEKKRASTPYLRFNRFASACNPALSVLVDKGRFNFLFSSLINREMIDRPTADQDRDWHSRNLFLTEQLTAALQFDPGENIKVDDARRNIFVWHLYERYHSSPFQLKKQIVKYGPPGTGKTFLSRREMQDAFLTWKEESGSPLDEDFDSHYLQLQFHPSFGYEDFIEGLRPVQIKDKDLQGNEITRTELRLKNGKFKEFCRKAGRWEIDLAKLNIHPNRVAEQSYLDEPLKVLMADASAKERLLKAGDHWGAVFDVEERFRECRLSDMLPPYYVLIDEINRAELSRTFGELMFCLEYRGVKGAVSTQYAELNGEVDAMLRLGNDALFFVPTNVYIVGTMNTIDRSVESFDFALRRRFAWKLVEPNAGVLTNYLAEHQKWIGEDDRRKLVEYWSKLNEAIKNHPSLGPDYRIGHAYLMGLKYDRNQLDGKVANLRRAIWKDSLRPLLEEYLRGSYDDRSSENPVDQFAKIFGVD